jgi:hypothetical protein
MSDNEKTGGFGFASSNETIRGLAASIKPKQRSAEEAPRALAQTADKVAEEIGFESRESPRRVVKRPTWAPAEPMQQLAMRLPVSVLQQFARFAEAEGLSYPKALAELLSREQARQGKR